ncbi:MAG: DNA recombination protein RmuC, partial [Pseudomonadota bacterium]
VEFRAAASKALGDAHRTFLERADDAFARHRATSNAEADGRRRALDDLIKPMRDTLARYEDGLAAMRAEQSKARGELIGRIGDLAQTTNAVRLEANKLSSALRAGPKVRGRWGEEQLRNVVELAGMTAHVDFVEQKSYADENRRLQPDMIVALPGDRVIAVDSKVSINAFLDAAEAEEEALRAQHIERHASDLWAHVKTLSAKDYAAALRDSLDFVVMFVPGENYFAAAMEARPALFQDAFERKVLIATPTTLLAMLKSAAFGWRQEKAAENAAEVARSARDLYESLKTFSGHLSGLGKSLEQSVSRYNDLVGGVEARVLPRARKLAALDVGGARDAIETRRVEKSVRQPKDENAEPAPRAISNGR